MFKRFKKQEIFCPIDGKIIEITQVQDPVFASKSMGDGFAIEPKSGQVFSPINGKVTSIFPTKHAIGLITDNGLEVLLHIGIDTVDLDGKGFEILVSEGDKVTPQTQLANVDFGYLAKEGKLTTTMVIFTNLDGKNLTIQTGEKTAQTAIGKL